MRCGLDVAYLAEIRRLHDVLMKPPADPANPPAELVHAQTMENMARQMVAELLLLDEGYGHESEHMFWAPLASGETVRTLQAVLWDHDEDFWRSRDPDEVDMYFEHLTGPAWSHADPAQFLEFYVNYKPFMDLIKANGASWAETANATIQGVIATRRAEHASGYWDRHEARWGFYGKLWVSKYPNWLQGLIRRNNVHMRTKATPELELDFMESWMARRSHAIANWAPTARPGDVRLVAYDMTWDVVMAAIVPLVAVCLVLLGLAALAALWVAKACRETADFQAL